MNAIGRYILLETLISMAINVAISALFVFWVFGRSEHIDLWGAHGFALDYLPQTFMISLMSVIVPTLLTRKRLHAGRVAARESPLAAWLPSGVVLRALLLACFAVTVLGGVAVWITASAWRGTPDFAKLLTIKLAYGALVAAVLTPVGLLVALADLRGDGDQQPPSA